MRVFRGSRLLLILFTGFVFWATPVLGEKVAQYTGDGSDLQPFVDSLPPHATVVCDESKLFTLRKPLVIRQALTLQGLHARLPENLGRTALIEVKAEGVTLMDLELHGNYDSVSQDRRNTLVWIARGGFRVERCHFFDGSKDGVMITPEPNHGDLVGGTVRGITAKRMGRDAVSISGGNRGARFIVDHSPEV